MKKYKVESTSRVYEILWTCSERNLRDALGCETGSWYYYLTAMTMAYFSYEAFLNHILLYAAPDIWKKEKEYFSKPPYKGEEGKLKKICEVANIPFPNKGVRPYQSVAYLKQLRDMSSHGRTEHHEYEVKAENGANLCVVTSELHAKVNEKIANQTISDLKSLIKSINTQVRERLYCEDLAINPLEGFSGNVTVGEVSQR